MPDWKRYIRAHLPHTGVKPAREAGVVEELALQLDQAYEDALRSGCDPAEAERRAKAQLRDWDVLAREIERSMPEHRAEPRIGQGVSGDLRHAFRLLRRGPLFTAVAVATLALGIGGCTAIFSLVEAVLLRPIDYRDPGSLVMVWESQSRRNVHKNVVAMADYLDWKARNHVFSDITPIIDNQWNLTGPTGPSILNGMVVNERFLPMLGVQPLIGRSFTAAEARVDGPRVAILSHRLWTERYGASRSAIGQTIVLDAVPRTIVGVLPAGFPWLGAPLDVLVPIQIRDRDWRLGGGRFLRVAARLRPGVSVRQAQGEMSSIARQLEREYPVFNKYWGVEVVPLAEHFAGSAGTGLWVLMAAVGLVLLIACSNVANLLLARAVAREREMALRAALGASRGRLVRLALIESLVLAVLGGIVGCAGAYGAVRLIQAYGPQDVARLQSATLNVPVALFTLLVSVFTGVIFGLAPAFAAGRLDLAATLKEGGRGVLNTIRGARLRGILAVSQVGLALVLLTGASLLLESLYRLTSVSPGFDPHNVLTGSIMIGGRMENAKMVAMCGQMLESVRRLPGVESAGFLTFLPFTDQGAATDFSVVGRPPYAPGQAPVTDVEVVLPGYFETMRIPLLRGRVFTDADNRANVPRAFIVNETLARQIFGAANPLGERLVVAMGDDTPGEIVGVVGDTKKSSLAGAVRPMVYYPLAQLPIGMGTFLIRTKSRPNALATALVAAVQSINKDQPVTDVRTMDDWIARSVANERFQTWLLAAFAFIAVTLSVIGVYGVMAYAVEQRTHEIGVRLALGAEPARLKGWITVQGMRLAAIGLAAGLLAAAASTRVLTSLLFHIKPGDPVTFVSATLLLAAACLAASYIPARRATIVDPSQALRSE